MNKRVNRFMLIVAISIMNVVTITELIATTMTIVTMSYYSYYIVRGALF